MSSGGLSSVDASKYGYHTTKKGKSADPAKSDSANEWFYKRQEAMLNQELALESASVQNQYMVDQWNRENAYNDPSAVRDRYEAAGISAHAAFGTGAASGAGIAAHSNSGSVGSGSATGSYGKSDLSQGIERASALGGLVSHGVGVVGDVLDTMSQVKTRKSQRDLISSQTEGQNYENEFLKPLERAIKQSLSSSSMSDAEIKKVQASWEPYFLELRSLYEEGNIEYLNAKRKGVLQEIETSKSYQALNEEQKNAVKASITETFARITRYAYQNSLDDALTNLYYAQKDTQLTIQELNRAMTGTQKAQEEYLLKQVDLIASQMKLNDAQIEKWKAEVKHMWAKFGTDVAFNTSAEVRNWVSMFMPFGKRNPVGFGR